MKKYLVVFFTLIFMFFSFSGCVKRNANIIQAESLFHLEDCGRAVIYFGQEGIEVISEEDMRELRAVFNGLELRKLEPAGYEGGAYIVFYKGTDKIYMGLHGEVIAFGNDDYEIQGGLDINKELEKYLSKLSANLFFPPHLCRFL